MCKKIYLTKLYIMSYYLSYCLLMSQIYPFIQAPDHAVKFIENKQLYQKQKSKVFKQKADSASLALKGASHRGPLESLSLSPK